jgi:hypothetical protein
MVLSSTVHVHPHFKQTLMRSFLEFRESDRSRAELDFLTDGWKNCSEVRLSKQDKFRMKERRKIMYLRLVERNARPLAITTQAVNVK